MRITLFLALLALPATAAAQLQLATIHGVVRAPDGTPAPDAVVTLVDRLGATLATATTGPDGRFSLPNVAPGTYALRAEAPSLRATLQPLSIGGALPLDLDLRLSPVAAEQVVVRANDVLEPGSTTTRVTLAGEAVRRAAARVRTRGLQDAVATAPGWSTEDNGLLHVRGVDDGLLYVIDGVPIYERLDGLFGMAPDPAMIDAVNISTGYIAPEFGFKSGGVIEIRSAERAATEWTGSAEAAVGSEATRHLSVITGGPLGVPAAVTLGVTRQHSSRFLDPVHPDNLHNTGGAFSGGAQFGWRLSPASTLNAVAGFARSLFDVPHGEDQEEAGQDQRQRATQHWQTLTWQRVWSPQTVSQFAAYHRVSTGRLMGSDADMPLFTDADRSLRRIGVLASVTLSRGRHLLKAGGELSALQLHEQFTMAVTDRDEAIEAGLIDRVLRFTPATPFVFDDRARPTLASFYLQDSLRPLDRLTVDLGVRVDWSRMLASASQWSPRFGVSYRWPRSDTAWRASLGRFFQPPQPENLLLASSTAARALSPFETREGIGGADLGPERQTAVETGIEQIIAGTVRLDAAYWRRWVTDAGDPNVFFGTTIIFPNSVAKGHASGLDVRLELPRRRGWSAYASYTNSRVEQFGPITGGLFLEDDVLAIGSGEAFTPDHDQRHVAAYGVTFDHERTGLWISATGRYESGTPLEVDDDEIDELLERPGAELIAVDRGRVNPRHVWDIVAARRILRSARIDLTPRVSLLNITGARWAYNFGNPFSGTHFGPGRTFELSIRAAFR